MTDENIPGIPTEKLAMFEDTPKSVKSLRRHYRDKTRPPDFEALRPEIEKESDRSVVLLMAAFLDEALSYCLVKNLSFKPTPDEADDIFRFEGPLGTFSARIEIARLFGVIDETAYRQLELIREMRNACAHSMRSISFADPVLRTILENFVFGPLGSAQRPSSEIDSASQDKLKTLLVTQCNVLFLAMIQGAREKATWVIAYLAYKYGLLNRWGPGALEAIREQLATPDVDKLFLDGEDPG